MILKKIIVVLDSASILNASFPLQFSQEVYVPQSVVKELISFSGEHKWIVFKEMNEVREEELVPQDVGVVRKRLHRKLRDRLSQTDIEVLALARKLRGRGILPVIITDDYALQKASVLFQIPCQGVMFPSIKEQQRLNEQLRVSSIIKKEM